jgi:hypothetical protein
MDMELDQDLKIEVKAVNKLFENIYKINEMAATSKWVTHRQGKDSLSKRRWEQEICDILNLGSIDDDYDGGPSLRSLLDEWKSEGEQSEAESFAEYLCDNFGEQKLVHQPKEFDRLQKLCFYLLGD